MFPRWHFVSTKYVSYSKIKNFANLTVDHLIIFAPGKKTFLLKGKVRRFTSMSVRCWTSLGTISKATCSSTINWLNEYGVLKVFFFYVLQQSNLNCCLLYDKKWFSQNLVYKCVLNATLNLVWIQEEQRWMTQFPVLNWERYKQIIKVWI